MRQYGTTRTNGALGQLNGNSCESRVRQAMAEAYHSKQSFFFSRNQRNSVWVPGSCSS